MAVGYVRVCPVKGHPELCEDVPAERAEPSQQQNDRREPARRTGPRPAANPSLQLAPPRTATRAPAPAPATATTRFPDLYVSYNNLPSHPEMGRDMTVEEFWAENPSGDMSSGYVLRDRGTDARLSTPVPRLAN